MILDDVLSIPFNIFAFPHLVDEEGCQKGDDEKSIHHVNY